MKNKNQESAPVFQTEVLLKSKAFSGFQPDFAKAILIEEAYTKDKALSKLKKVLKGGR